MIERYYSEEPSRGRPKGHQSFTTMTILTSIAHIAAKYNLDPKMLLDALSEAQIREESRYNNLKIQCRKTDQDIATFLITYKDKAVWQFPIDLEIIKEPELFKSYIPAIPNQIQKTENLQKQICELRAKMKGITIKARIKEVPPKNLVNTKYGWKAYVSNILLADDTGTIRLSLWNNQIDDVAVGDTIKIERAAVATFLGELQLRIGRKGSMNIDKSTRELITTNK